MVSVSPKHAVRRARAVMRQQAALERIACHFGLPVSAAPTAKLQSAWYAQEAEIMADRLEAIAENVEAMAEELREARKVTAIRHKKREAVLDAKA